MELVVAIHVVFFLGAGLVYLAMGGRFRAHALKNKAGASIVTWVIDSPMCLILAQTVPMASICQPEYLGQCGIVLTGILAVIATTVALWRIAMWRHLHPYLFSIATILLLVLLKQENAALWVGALLLLVFQGYEERLWRLIGEVTIWGQGTHCMDRDLMGTLGAVMSSLALTSIGFQFAAYLFDKTSDIETFRAIVLFAAYLSVGALVCSAGLRISPFTLPGLNWVQGRLASWTFDGFGQEPGSSNGFAGGSER